MLIVEAKINEKRVAIAVAVNVAHEGEEVIGMYNVSATTTQPNPFGEILVQTHHLEINDHPRGESVWSLIAKIATQLAEREK